MTKLLPISAIIFIFLVNSNYSIYLNPVAYIPINPTENYDETLPDSVEIFFTKLPTKPYDKMGIFIFHSDTTITMLREVN